MRLSYDPYHTLALRHILRYYMILSILLHPQVEQRPGPSSVERKNPVHWTLCSLYFVSNLENTENVTTYIFGPRLRLLFH